MTVARQYPSRRPATPFDVISFNWPPFALGPLIAIASGVAVLAILPSPVSFLFGVAAVAAVAATSAALVAVVWVFSVTAERRWGWVVGVADSPQAWLNVTTGFDDSTPTLTERLAGTRGSTIDVVETAAPLDGPQRLGRDRFPPTGRAATPATLESALRDVALDCAFLLMAAHEFDDAERLTLFTSIADRLRPDGRLVVVEHLRDLPNTLAFGLGARHFQARETWLGLAHDAGLTTLQERSLSPFVRGFVFGHVLGSE